MKEKAILLPAEIKELSDKVSIVKQEEVQIVLNQIFAGTADWEKQIDKIEIKNIDDELSIKMADVARKNVKSARLKAEKVFDEKRAEVQTLMADYKLEDALWLKSKQIMQLKFKHTEEKAKFKADFVKRHQEEQRNLKLNGWLDEARKYKPDVLLAEIQYLADEVFKTYLSGLKKAFDDKKEAEIKAEKERIAAVKAEKERIKKIEIENKRLAKEKKEAEKLQAAKDAIYTKRNDILAPYIQFIRDYNTLINMSETNFEKEFEDIKQAAKDHYLYEAEQKRQRELEADKLALERKKQAETLAAEREQRQKFADKLEAERVLKVKKEKDKKAAEKSAKLAPDKDKLLKLADDLLLIPMPDLKSDEAKSILHDVNVLFGKIKTHIEKGCKSL